MVKAVVAASLFAASQASDIAVSFSDCGDSSTHAKVTKLEPHSISTGTTTRVTGTGALDKDVAGATFEAVIKAFGKKVANCEGDASKDVVCKLPLSTGSITLKAQDFPMKKGTVSLPVDIKLKAGLPASLAKTTTHVTAKSDKGDKLVCLDVNTEKKASADVTQSTNINLGWSDCGDSSTHAKVTKLEPHSISTGKTTRVTGTGALDKDVTGATFETVIKAFGKTVANCGGDASKDVVCKLPLSTGEITLKAQKFPMKKGAVSLPVDIKLKAGLPPSLAKTSTHVTATSDKGEKLVCMDINTEKTAFSDLVEHINSLNTTWTAGHSKFSTFEEVAARCGTVLEHEDGYQVPEDFQVNNAEAFNAEIPSDFDVREQWPQCAEVSGHIRDQSACGSCWAHGSTEALNDRHCIATGSTKLLSTEDTTANCNALSLCFSFGCGGGQPAFVWQWFKRVGVVTGGDYANRGDGTGCAPYSLPSCQHHGWVPPTPEHPSCPSKEYATPSPFHACSESDYQISFSQDKVKASSAYGVRGEKNIQNDIMTYGSVTAAFTVYEDFPSYKTGVYQHHSGKALGGHAVKMLGWGIENGTPYWLVANSWNEDWGNKGFFKILRGSNHCGIESQITAGHVGSVLV